MLRISIGIVAALLISVLLAILLKVFVIGKPLSTYEISTNEILPVRIMTNGKFNDQLFTDGDFESRDFEMWISLDEPYKVLIYDYKTGEYTDDYFIID